MYLGVSYFLKLHIFEARSFLSRWLAGSFGLTVFKGGQWCVCVIAHMQRSSQREVSMSGGHGPGTDSGHLEFHGPVQQHVTE